MRVLSYGHPACFVVIDLSVNFYSEKTEGCQANLRRLEPATNDVMLVDFLNGVVLNNKKPACAGFLLVCLLIG